MANRRSNGEGTFRKRKDGTWEWQATISCRTDGKSMRKSFYGKTKKEAKEKGQKFIRSYGESTIPDMNGFTSFSAWADYWYAGIKDDVTITTYEGYKYTLTYLKNYFKDKPLCEIKAMHIEKFLKEIIREGKSKSYQSKCRGMLFQIFQWAAANELIKSNPVALTPKAHKLRRIGDEKSKGAKDSFTAEEVRFLCKNLPDNRIGWSIKLMIGTGMRTQEVLALEPRHISEDGSSIQIHQAIIMNKGTAELGPTKTESSYRTVPVPKSLRECAVKLRNTDHDFCWWGVRTPFINPSTFRTKYKEVMEEIGAERILTPHCCRHTFVSQMQAKEVDLETIKNLSGHSDIKMTEHYNHVQEEAREKAVEAIDSLFTP